VVRCNTYCDYYTRPVNQPIVMGLELCKKRLGMQTCHHLPLGLLPECLSTHSFSPFTITVQHVPFSNKNLSIHIFHVERLIATLSPEAFYTSIIKNNQGQAGYTSESNSTHICIRHLNDNRDARILGTRSQW
jgi:hypothetical protein